MADYRLYCLGRPFLALNGQPVKLEMRKALALLVYLRMAEYDHSRESLAALFWPEYNQQRAQANLRRVLSSLNKSLLGDMLLADREKINLKDSKDIWLDVEQFQYLRSAPKKHAHPKEHICPDCLRSLEEAVQIYRGDFLAGFNLGDCTEYDEWQFLQGEGLRQDLAGTLQRLVEGYAAIADWDRAILHARRWVALDRLHEPAQRSLISLYSQAGQYSASLRQYEELTRLLRDELGEQPHPETVALVEKLRNEPKATNQGNLKDSPTEAVLVSRASEPLLRTKLYIPSSRREQVHRQHLIGTMNRIDQYPLVVLSAPAGFGKTTTLVEWVAQTALPIAWYSLDSDDNDARRFLNYLIAAFESVHKDVGSEARTLLHASRSTPLPLVLTHLIHDLEEPSNPFVLVLDDYQLITAQAIHDMVSYLLEHLPPHIHIILATRADPPLKLSRLRSKGELLEIRTNDLRFNTREAYEYFNLIMGLPLTEDEIIRLNNKIEGWIVGLQMAALSMRDNVNLSGFIESFSGTNRYILDYLLEEVLAGQPAEIQRFLLYTSILERLSTPLCDAILSPDEIMLQTSNSGSTTSNLPVFDLSATMLDQLEKANLFLTPMDNERIWYRYHHLFADLLRTRLLRAIGKQGVAKLHARASDWHAHHGSIMEAINHASSAADDARVERYIEQNYRELVSRGEQSWMRSWTGKLGTELVYRRPWLCIYEAMSHSWFGELDDADRLLDIAGKHIRTGGSDLDPRSIQGLHAYVKSRVTAMRGDIDQAIELCLNARQLTPDSNVALLLDTHITLGYEYFMKGDYANAIPVLKKTIQLGSTIGAVINTVAASCVLARLYGFKGLLHEAYKTYQLAEQLIPEAREEHRGARALIDIGLAEIYYEQNNLDAAFTHIKQGLARLSFWGKADDYILANITLARIWQAQSKMYAAEEAVEKAIQLVQASGIFPEARNAIEIAQVQLWLNQGELTKAVEWLEKRLDCPERYSIWQESKDITATRILLALGRNTEAQNNLARLIVSSKESRRLKHLIEALTLHSLTLHGAGCDREAMENLQQALTLAQPEGFVRIFLDEGPSLKSLLLLGKEQGRWNTSPLKEYVVLLLNSYEEYKPHH